MRDKNQAQLIVWWEVDIPQEKSVARDTQTKSGRHRRIL